MLCLYRESCRVGVLECAFAPVGSTYPIGTPFFFSLRPNLMAIKWSPLLKHPVFTLKPNLIAIKWSPLLTHPFMISTESQSYRSRVITPVRNISYPIKSNQSHRVLLYRESIRVDTMSRIAQSLLTRIPPLEHPFFFRSGTTCYRNKMAIPVETSLSGFLLKPNLIAVKWSHTTLLEHPFFVFALKPNKIEPIPPHTAVP